MYIRGSLLKLRLWLELLAFEASEHCCAVVVRLARGPNQLEWRLAFRGSYFTKALLARRGYGSQSDNLFQARYSIHIFLCLQHKGFLHLMENMIFTMHVSTDKLRSPTHVSGGSALKDRRGVFLVSYSNYFT